MGYDRNVVLNVARGELGYHEKASNSQLDDKTANSGSGNWTKYARDLDAIGFFYNGPKNGYAWCDVGADWCFVKAYGVEAALKLLCQPKYSGGAGCYYSAMYYKQCGQFHGPNTVPQPGDQIFFSYSAGDVGHTGIVEAVNGNQITAIEFNTSDMVARRYYTVGQSCIYGYGRPSWGMDELPVSEKPAAGSDDTDDEITVLAHEVIDGKWGTGSDRVSRLTAAGHDYAAVQARVNEILSGKVSDPPPAETPPVASDNGEREKYSIFLEELREGDTGTAVERVQTLLIARGYRCGGKIDRKTGVETPDGEFGPSTKKAVIDFQKAASIQDSDGRVLADTMKALLK